MNDLSRGKVPSKHEVIESDDEHSKLMVRILDKEFQVTCAADEQDDLIHAAEQLDKRMRDIRDTGKVIGIERIAIMAGLNITNEMLQAKDVSEGKDTTNLLKKINRKVDKALQSARQLEI